MSETSTVLNDFLNNYQTLSKSCRKVFEYLHHSCRTWRNTFPSIQMICTTLGCSDSTVKRAISYLKRMGWISTKKRGYQSNLYFMNAELVKLNLDDKTLFERKDLQRNDIHIK